MSIVVKCESCNAEVEMVEKNHDRESGPDLQPPNKWWTIPGYHTYTCSLHCTKEWMKAQKKGELWHVNDTMNCITPALHWESEWLITNDLAALVERDYFEVIR